MCNHGLNKRGSSDKEDLLRMEEYQSPFGIYELKIPKDECDSEQLKAENCKDLDVRFCITQFLKLHLFVLKQRQKATEQEDLSVSLTWVKVDLPFSLYELCVSRWSLVSPLFFFL